MNDQKAQNVRRRAMTGTAQSAPVSDRSSMFSIDKGHIMKASNG